MRADENTVPCPHRAVQSNNLPEAEIVGRRKVDPVASKRKRAGETTDQYCAGAENEERLATGAQRVIPGF